MGRAASAAVLAGGLAVLVVGTSLALRRESAPAAVSSAPDSLVEAGGVPRLDVTYVQMPLAAYESARAGEADAPLPFTVVPTEVEERLLTGEPPLHPDFGTLFHLGEYEGRPTTLAAFARAFREKRLANERLFVVGLLVERPVSGPPLSLRLEAERTVLRGYREMLDPIDATEEFADDTVVARDAESSERTQIEWEAAPAAEAQLVPLFVLHSFRLPDTPENREVIEAGGQQYGWSLGSYTVLGPRRLFARVGDGPEREIDISLALTSPLFVEGMK